MLIAFTFFECFPLINSEKLRALSPLNPVWLGVVRILRQSAHDWLY